MTSQDSLRGLKNDNNDLTCFHCQQPLNNNNIIQALDRFYHDRCFVCKDCQMPLASEKYYALNNNNDRLCQSIIVCEKHYYIYLGLLCRQCQEPIQVNAPSETLDDGFKYHQHCVQCPGCVLLEQQPATRRRRSSSSKVLPRSHQEWYRYDGRTYCRYHFSLLRGTECVGCSQAVFHDPVLDPLEKNKLWHEECFMIFKYWNARLADPRKDHHDAFRCMSPEQLMRIQVEAEKTRKLVWTELRAFEDSLATCLSDMALHITARVYQEGTHMANQFVWHLKILLNAHQVTHQLYAQFNKQTYECDKLSRAVVIRVEPFLQLLTDVKETSPADVVPLVTELAYRLKSLLAIGLAESLQLKHEYGIQDAVRMFLDAFLQLRKNGVWVSGRFWFKDTPFPEIMCGPDTDRCPECGQTIDGSCYRFEHSRWHAECLICQACRSSMNPDDARISSRGEEVALLCQRCITVTHQKRRSFYAMQQSPLSRVTQLEQCLHLLRIALARVVAVDGGGSKKKQSPAKTHELDAKKIKSNMMVSGQPLPSPPTVVKRAKSTQLDPSNNNNTDHQDHETVLRRTTTVHPPVLDTAKATNNSNRIGGTLRRALSAGRRWQRPQLNNPDGDKWRNCCWLTELTTTQDTVIRYLAAFHIQPFVKELFTLDELLGLVESRKTSSLWDKLKTHIRGGTYRQQTMTTSSTTESCKTFGVSLVSLTTRERRQDNTRELNAMRTEALKYIMKHHPSMAVCFAENALVPSFVQNCILALLQSDMSMEGIFRKNGNIRELKEACEMIDRDGRYLDYLVKQSPIQLAALLKRYLRDLPEPLLTFKLYKLFITSIRTDSEAETKKLLHYACCMLPKPNRDVMQILFMLLSHVASFHEQNKMSIHNLAVIFTPTILYAPPLSSSSPPSSGHRQKLSSNNYAACTTTQEEVQVVTMLLQYQNEFYKVPKEFTSLLQDTRITQLLASMDPPSSKEFIRICSEATRG